MVSDPSTQAVVTRSFVFGERGLVNLFRGAGGLLGSSGGGGGSGLDTLNAQLQVAFQDYFWSSQVFDSYEGSVTSFQEIGSQQALAFNAQFDQVAALGVVGYSAGGLSAIRVAQGQGQGSAPVSLVVQMDTYDPLTGSSREDEILPSNVVKGINYYQEANRLNPFQPGFDPFDLQGARVVEGSENINAEALLGDRGITHRTLDDNPGLQQQILQNIETYVLQDLRFDRAGQLNLAGGAQLTNNILELAPAASGAAGQALIDTAFAIDGDFSFQTRFEFRLPNIGAPGLSFWLEPGGDATVRQGQSSVAVAFEPLSFGPAFSGPNAIALLTPDLSPGPLVQAPAPLDLDSGESLTAWIDYDGVTDQLAVFLGDTLTRPSAPVWSYGIDLPAITGSEVYFGFQTTVQGAERQAELLSWQLSAIGESEETLSNPVVEAKRLPFDYNGDGKADFAFFRAVADPAAATLGQLGVWLLDGLSFPLAQAVVDTFPFQAPDNQLIPALPLRNLDFNGDGKTDFLFGQSLNTQPDSFELVVWEMDGTAAGRQATIGTVGPDWSNPIAVESFAPRLPLSYSKGPLGDFNGDRTTDFLFLKTANPSGERDLAVWLMDGITPIAQTVVGSAGADWLPFNLNDFNGDRTDDILFERQLSDGSVDYGLWLMDGVAPASKAMIGSVAAGAGWRAVDTNDFSGDRKADILFSRPASAPGQTEYALWVMDGTTPLQQAAIGTSGAGWVLIDHNDFNGDGKADLLFKQAASENGEQYGVWLMDGPSILAQAVVGTATEGWQFLGSADINGDGKADLEFVNPGSRQVASWLMDGTMTTAQGIIGSYDNPDLPAGWQPPFAVPGAELT